MVVSSNSMIRLKTAEEIKILREGGKRLAHILYELKDMVKPGVTTLDVENRARELFKETGGSPAFYKYTPHGNKSAFPAYMCVSVNEVIVHGIPNVNPVTFKEGDIVTVDGGMKYKNLITDSAITFVVGDNAPKEIKRLLSATEESMYKGIKSAVVGGHIGDIGEAVQSVAQEHDFGLAQHLSGHGVGYEIHEEPYVPNEGRRGQGELLKEGLVIAIEPMFTLGGGEVDFSDDEFTVTTTDGSLSAHFEHTIAVTVDGPIILTKK